MHAGRWVAALPRSCPQGMPVPLVEPDAGRRLQGFGLVSDRWVGSLCETVSVHLTDRGINAFESPAEEAQLLGHARQRHTDDDHSRDRSCRLRP